MFYEEEDSWVSGFWFRLFASVLLFSCSHCRVLLSTFRPSSSLVPLSTSCQPSVVPPSTEPQDSQRTISEVVVGATRPSGDDATAVLVALEVTMAIAVDSSREAAGTSHDVSLALSSPHRPSSPSAPLSAEDVVHQFDATHRLSELTASWGDFVTFATSFVEKLQVSFLKFFLWMFIFLLFLCLFSFFLLVQSFSRDHTGFFFSSETEKKLSSELSALKAELDLC